MRSQNLPCNRKIMNKYPPERIICYNLNLTIDKNRLVRLFNILLPCSWITVWGFPFWGFLKFAGKELCRYFFYVYIYNFKRKVIKIKSNLLQVARKLFLFFIDQWNRYNLKACTSLAFHTYIFELGQISVNLRFYTGIIY